MDEKAFGQSRLGAARGCDERIQGRLWDSEAIALSSRNGDLQHRISFIVNFKGNFHVQNLQLVTILCNEEGVKVPHELKFPELLLTIGLKSLSIVSLPPHSALNFVISALSPLVSQARSRLSWILDASRVRRLSSGRVSALSAVIIDRLWMQRKTSRNYLKKVSANFSKPAKSEKSRARVENVVGVSGGKIESLRMCLCGPQRWRSRWPCPCPSSLKKERKIIWK